jgi:RNA polymerase sigma factor (sigma-70 family)
MDSLRHGGSGGRFEGLPPAATSLDLLRRARHGDRTALDALFARQLPWLYRWTHGRIPQWARRFGDTADVVQDSMLSVFGRLEAFEPRREGAFRAYLRQAVLNRIRDNYRRSVCRPDYIALDSAHPDAGVSPLESAMTGQITARFVAALERLSPEEREAVVARVELGYSYEQVATLLQKRSADAARMMVTRALVKVAKDMADVARERD